MSSEIRAAKCTHPPNTFCLGSQRTVVAATSVSQSPMSSNVGFNILHTLCAMRRIHKYTTSAEDIPLCILDTYLSLTLSLSYLFLYFSLFVVFLSLISFSLQHLSILSPNKQLEEFGCDNKQNKQHFWPSNLNVLHRTVDRHRCNCRLGRPIVGLTSTDIISLYIFHFESNFIQ